jgi:putative colanic acid biosynthesis acetyltransferase WcaF
MTKFKELNRIHIFSFKQKIYRLSWQIIWWPAKKLTPRNFHFLRIWTLRLFGADIHWNVSIYPNIEIYDPKNLVMEEGSCISPNTDIYNVERITLKKGASISQYTFICTASHNYKTVAMETIAAPIVIGEEAWVMSKVMIGPGVTVGDRAVIKSGSFVYRNIPSNTVVCLPPERLEKNYVKE